MSSLFAALRSSADALGIFQRALTVSGNNVSNASTPGYAKQTQGLEALRFDPDAGIIGGVAAGPLESSRNEYAEAAVRRQVTALGRSEAQVNTLTPLQSGFDISGAGGIAGALSGLFQSFSAWSVAPNDGSSRQKVLDQAQAVVDSFHQTAATLSRASSDADTQLGGLVDQVNTLAGKLRDYNVQRRGGDSQDAGLDAAVHSTLEQLSEIADVTALRQPDGSVTVLLNGQTTLVVGEFQYKIGLDISVPTTPPPTYAGAPPSARVLDAAGTDITSQIQQGQLGGLLDVRNRVLASLRGDATQPGDLNRLAQSFADSVNGLLQAGHIDEGPAVTPPAPAVPTPGVPLFAYDTTNSTSVAQTLKLTDITAAQLAAIDPGPPYAANGTAVKLANLASTTSATAKIDNQTYTEFYGNLAARVGRETATATDNLNLQKDLTAQARDLRQQSSGVSLDEEAINVLAFQRSYQAAAKMVTVLDQLTQTVMGLLTGS